VLASDRLPTLSPPEEAYPAAAVDAVFRALCAELDALTVEVAAAKVAAEQAEARVAALDGDQTLTDRAVTRTTRILEARRREVDADSQAIVADARAEAARRTSDASAEADAILASVKGRRSHLLEARAVEVPVESDAGVHEEFWREAREADSSALRHLPTYALLQAGAVLLLLGLVLVFIG
jgi:hypothetical protein